MYWNQVQGRKVAGSSKQATLGDSGVTHFAAVNMKYNVQTKNMTEIGLFRLNHLLNFD